MKEEGREAKVSDALVKGEEEKERLIREGDRR